MPHLRIIDDDLWRRVNSRRHGGRRQDAPIREWPASGRPPKNAVQNLLAGLATCGDMRWWPRRRERRQKTRTRIRNTSVHRHRDQRHAVTNALRIRVADMNEAVLQAIEEHALTPEAIEQVIQLSERDDVVDQRATTRTGAQGRGEAHRQRSPRRWRLTAVDVALIKRLRELEAAAHGHRQRRWPACGPSHGWPPLSSRIGWPNGDACSGHPRRRGAPSSSASCVAG